MPPLRSHHVPRWLRLSMLTVVLLLYPAILLWPYEWETPRQVSNGAEWLPAGGIRFDRPGIVYTDRAAEWLPNAIKAGRLTMSLSLQSASPQQAGPARILTVSASPYQRNITVGQAGSDLVLRVRTPETSANGTIDGSPVARVSNVFATGDWVEVEIQIEPVQVQITVDGEIRTSETLPTGATHAWNSSFPLALGNELSGNRPWLGSIRRANVSVGDVAVDYTRPSVLQRPASFWYFRNYPKLVPLEESRIRDLVANLLLFMPLGALLAMSPGVSTRHVVVSAMMLTALISGTLETLQLFVSIRNPSVDDFTCNTLGGGIGALAARMFFVPKAGPV